MKKSLARQALLEELGQDIADGRVLRAIGEVRRECFVPPNLRKRAWENRPLPIGEGQTISQPFVVARMCELLELQGDETVLDVGTGSGYHAAVLARLTARVVSIERRAGLTEAAARNLLSAGVENVELVVGDGSRGHPATAPYDAISVAAASSSGVPQELEDQLAPGGRLVIPAGADDQRLVLVRSLNGTKRRESLERVRFVPLITEGRDRAAANGPVQSTTGFAG